MNDYVKSLIRTYTPGVVAAIIGIFGLPESMSADLTVALSVLFFATYYGIVRKVEEYWPSAGWLLGKDSPPTY